MCREIRQLTPGSTRSRSMSSTAPEGAEPWEQFQAKGHDVPSTGLEPGLQDALWSLPAMSPGAGELCCIDGHPPAQPPSSAHRDFLAAICRGQRKAQAAWGAPPYREKGRRKGKQEVSVHTRRRGCGGAQGRVRDMPASFASSRLRPWGGKHVRLVLHLLRSRFGSRTLRCPWLEVGFIPGHHRLLVSMEKCNPGGTQPRTLLHSDFAFSSVL